MRHLLGRSRGSAANGVGAVSEKLFYKVIRKSNYDHDDWRGNEVFATAYSFSKETAEAICNLMNEDQYRNHEDWFAVVPGDYVLPKEWEP